jgi:hypothetical protein
MVKQTIDKEIMILHSIFELTVGFVVPNDEDRWLRHVPGCNEFSYFGGKFTNGFSFTSRNFFRKIKKV